jgi:hypothetical protein
LAEPLAGRWDELAGMQIEQTADADDLGDPGAVRAP